MTTTQRARRRSIWLSSAGAILFYGVLLMAPAIGGMITG